MEYCKEKVKLDCEELLGHFQKTESVRFEIFCNIWKKMKFSQIFNGMLGSEKKAFSRQILDTACSFFLPPFTFQIRVGGLYLLYSLYHTQTASPKEQIRISLKDWEQVKTFECDAVEAQHLDVVYILRQLMHHKAFHFTAMPTLLTYQVKKNSGKLLACEDFVERTSRPQQLVSLDLMEELTNVHEHYERLKTSICPTPDRPDPSLSLIQDSLVPQLQSAVVDFLQWQKQKIAPSENSEDSGEGTSAQQESSRRAELLASIKSKSYGQAMEVSRARRHRPVEMSFAGSSESEPAGESAHRKQKLSLKARTNKNVQVTSKLKKETGGATKLWSLTTLESAPEDVPRKFPKFKW